MKYINFIQYYYKLEKDIKNARTVVIKEKRAVSELESRFLNKKFQNSFLKAVDLIFRCKGKAIISGMGKSGIIAQKIVATLNSTGTHSVFLHSADSIHGDLGIVEENDIICLISKSGGTNEIKTLIPFFKELKTKIIFITGNVNSDLAKVCDVVLDASVSEEACPHNLVPTSSSTAMLVLGDALAVTLLQKRGFTKEDFAYLHPGGILGRKLLLKVRDIMMKGKNIPVVTLKTKLKDVIYEISSKRLGCAVVKNKSKIEGMITDGDIRRMLGKDFDANEIRAVDMMSRNPKTILDITAAKTALEIMEKNKITQLIILDSKKKLAGVLHIHTLVELGL